MKPGTSGQVQKFQSGVDPYQIVNKNLSSVQKYFGEKEKALRSYGLDPEAHNQAIAKLQGEYDQAKFQITSMRSQLDTIKQGMARGRIDPTLGREAMVRMVVPPETADAMFPKQAPVREGGLSPGQAKTLKESFGDRITAATINPKGWGKANRKQVDPELLKEQYFTARAEYGYDTKPKADKIAFDLGWDSTIGSNKLALTAWKKVREDPEIKTARTYDSRLLNIAARKVQGQGLSPFAASIQKQAPKQQEPRYQVNKTTGQKRVSYDGGKTWQVM